MKSTRRTTVTKSRQLGARCSVCGATETDPYLLEAAQTTAWICGKCRAVNKPLASRNIVTEVGGIEAKEAPDTSTERGRVDPDVLKRLHEEFLTHGMRIR